MFSRIAHTTIICGIISWIILLSGCTNSARDSDSYVTQNPKVITAASGVVELIGIGGKSSGTAYFTPLDNKLQITVKVSGLAPGIYQLFITKYANQCPNEYLNGIPITARSDGGVYQKIGHHGKLESGKLAGITVNQDGTGATVQVTDAFSLQDLSQGKGTALVVYGSDYLENSISDSQDSGPPKSQLAGTGFLCGIISAGSAHK